MKKILRKNFQFIISVLKKYFAEFADSYFEKFYLDLIIGFFENIQQTSLRNREFRHFEIRGEIPNISFLIGTSKQGLLLYHNGKITQLLQHKGFYGITKNKNNNWFAFHKTGLRGKIVSFKIVNNQIEEVYTYLWGLNRGIHQIDFIKKNKLAVINTYKNSILIYNTFSDHRNRFWRYPLMSVYPNGKLKRGRKSTNYNHFNSIFKYKDRFILLAHNETYKTKRKSELFITDLSFKDKKILKIKGSNCHNYYRNKNNEILCASLEKAIQINGENVLFLNGFTRGLSVADDFYIFGSSEIQYDKTLRDTTDGWIYIYDLDLNKVSSILIKRTQINEIRRIDKTELSMISY
ncbi:MAG: hypothetical protein ACFFAU_04715 [Candidatus Hodarchaeota archaeon]